MTGEHATQEVGPMDLSRLRTLPLFAGVDDHELESVATFASEDSAAEGTELLCEGEYSNDLLVIEEGTADVVRGGRRVASVGPGDVVGEAGLLSKEQRSATVVATSPMRLLRLSHWDVRRLGPEAKERLSAVVEERRTSVPEIGRAHV